MSKIHSLWLNSTCTAKSGASEISFKGILKKKKSNSLLIPLIGASTAVLETYFILEQLFRCFALKLYTGMMSLV